MAFFDNESADIIGLCAWALDLVGVPYRRSATRISVAMKGAVAALDVIVGPKS